MNLLKIYLEKANTFQFILYSLLFVIYPVQRHIDCISQLSKLAMKFAHQYLSVFEFKWNLRRFDRTHVFEHF